MWHYISNLSLYAMESLQTENICPMWYTAVHWLMVGHKSSSKLPISQCKERNMTHYVSHRVCELRTNQHLGRTTTTPGTET